MQVSTKLILASQSPRRHALLDQLDMAFTTQVSPASETITEDLPPDELVRSLAHRKAVPVAAEHPTALTLAADTIVYHDDAVLNKPVDDADARAMLRRLSGTTHTVYTGLALIHPASDRSVQCAEATEVTFGALTDAEIDAYVATGSPLDKAGGYGIQDHTGPLFVERIVGDYYNVMGLPLRRFYLTLRSDFNDLLLT